MRDKNLKMEENKEMGRNRQDEVGREVLKREEKGVKLKGHVCP
jgi:hypothetical protein